MKITQGLYLRIFKKEKKIERTQFTTKSDEIPQEWNILTPYLKGEADICIPFEKLCLEDYSPRVIRLYKKLKECVSPGNTITYSELAELSNEHSRFVGYCMRINRFPLIIPCHRVVGRKSLGGFSYGTDIKRKLLELEKRLFVSKFF